jgi:hypothetical protein
MMSSYTCLFARSRLAPMGWFFTVRAHREPLQQAPASDEQHVKRQNFPPDDNAVAIASHT